MLLPDYQTVKVEHHLRLQEAQVDNLARAAAARRRLAEPRPVFRPRALRALVRRVFAASANA